MQLALKRALVAQGIEHRPPEPGAQVRILPRAPDILPGNGSFGRTELLLSLFLAIRRGNPAFPEGGREFTVAGHIQRRGDDSWRVGAENPSAQLTRCTVPTGGAGRPTVGPGTSIPSHQISVQWCRVSGWTNNRLRRAVENSRLNPARTARSDGRRPGRATWRRNTETSWRTMATSMASSSWPPQVNRTSWSRRTKAT